MNRGELARFLRQVRLPALPADSSHTRRESACWIWVGPQVPNGYGKHRVGPGAPERAAHRVSFEHYVGPIPPGLQLDHLCRVRLCVNPGHLEVVTPAVNTTRQDHANRAKTHCPAGHEYTPENTRMGADGKRHCRACRPRRARNPST